MGFYPLRALDSGSYYAQTLVYEGLVRYSADMGIEPGLASTYSIDPGGQTYRFKLRPDAKFSDGASVNSADVVASINIAKSKVSPFRTDYDCIQKIDSNEQTGEITLHLSHPSAPLLSRLVELRILPSRLLAQPDHGKTSLSRQPIGTGPFILTRWQSGLELVFAPNPYYWGEKPQFRELVWRVVPDKTLLTMAMQHGELDIATIDATAWRSLGEASARQHHLVLDQFRGSRTVYLGFNLHKAPFDDLHVREGICESIDRKALVDKLFGGMALVPLTDVWPGSWAYNTTAKSWSFDPQRASQDLRSAGYSLSDKGWRKNGQLLAFRISTVRDFQDVAEVVADDLTRMHIACEVQVVEYSTLRQRYLSTGTFDVAVWSRSSGPDPECALVWGTGGAMNFSGFSNSIVDQLIAQARIPSDHAVRAVSYKKIQSILAEQLPWVFLAQPKLLLVHRDDIANTKQADQSLTGLPWDNPLFNAAKWRRLAR